MKPSERIRLAIDDLLKQNPDESTELLCGKADGEIAVELDLLDSRLTALESKPAVPSTKRMAMEIVDAICTYQVTHVAPDDIAQDIDEQVALVSAILDRHAQTKA